jgi:hypothetical protein
MHDRSADKRRPFIEAIRHIDTLLLAQAPTLQSYVSRIKASIKSFRHWDVEDEDRAPAYGYHRHIKATIKIVNGELIYSSDEYAPTVGELPKIKAELATVNWPRSIPANKNMVDNLKSGLGGDPERFCVFMAGNNKDVLFVQERIRPDPHDPTRKNDLPWSFWSDDKWRMMKPDGLLPLYNLPVVGRLSEPDDP